MKKSEQNITAPFFEIDVPVLMFYGGKCKPVPLPIAEFMEQVNYCKEQGYL